MKRLASVALLVLAACTTDNRHIRSDWELENAARLAKEGDQAARPPLPRFPQDGDLVAFDVQRMPAFRFYIDASTLSIDGPLVRYVLVARSGSGAENISFEGLNCRAGEYRLYASGQAGQWREQEVPWRDIGTRLAQRTLMSEYFCPRRWPIASAAEGVMALRRGGHPSALGAHATPSGR